MARDGRRTWSGTSLLTDIERDRRDGMMLDPGLAHDNEMTAVNLR